MDAPRNRSLISLQAETGGAEQIDDTYRAASRREAPLRVGRGELAVAPARRGIGEHVRDALGERIAVRR